MASATGLLGGDPPIDLRTKLPDHVQTVRLERMVPVACGAAMKHCAIFPLTSGSVDPEWVS